MKMWSRRQRAAGRHISYYDLREACAREGCPVCRLAERASTRFLDMLSYENVNDPGVRARLRASRGLCNYHAWRFVDEFDDGLGVAITYRDILENLLRVLEAQTAGVRRLGEALRGHRRRTALADSLAPARQCPACLQLEDAAGRYIDTLLAHLADTELREAYRASTGLCLPHLRQALSRSETVAEARLLTPPVAEHLDTLGSEIPADLGALAATLMGAEGALPSFTNRAQAQACDVEEEIQSPVIAPAVQDFVSCPACRSALAAGDATLRALATEHRQAAEPRPKGICHRHAWRLVRSEGGGGASALWRRLAKGAAEALARLSAAAEGAPAPGPSLTLPFLGRLSEAPSVSLVEGLANRGPCPACLAEAASEHSTVQQALGYMASGCGGVPSSGLCLPHSVLALRLANDCERAVLVRAQTGLYRALAADLSEYIRKRDYRFAHEPPGAEADSPRRAVASVAGAKGLQPFGIGLLAGPRSG